jgi:hypothetical protein
MQAVFIDEYGPFHKDYELSNNAPITTPERYYGALSRTFRQIEDQAKVQIVIAAYPSSNYEKHPDYFQNRPIIKHRTAELVRESACSTALNFAILFQRPILILTSADLSQDPMAAPLIGGLSSELKQHPLNMDEPLPQNWYSQLKVDESLYSLYRENYIKTVGSSEKPCIEILMDYLKNFPKDKR